MNRRFSWFVATGWLVALAACGGGSGGSGGVGGSSGGAAGGTGDTATTSGLLPAPPALGAVLYADARSLRPVMDGAAWSYRGTSVPSTGAAPITYLTTTTQAATNSSQTTEAATNSQNEGAASQQLSISDGLISNIQSVDFTGKGQPGAVNFTELRSPVRQGDQYTVLDKHYVDTAIDADGDGKADALDVAIYVRVAGAEALSVPNLPAMQAVRVDSFVQTRVIYSSNGQASPIIQASLQTWYVPGIGIVRQTSSTPATIGSGVASIDEQIVWWDGKSTGVGAMAPVTAVVPSTSGVFPGQYLPSPYVKAFAFTDHALVLTTAPGGSFVNGVLASVVDLRGKFTATTLLPGLSAGGFARVTPVAGGLAFLDATTENPSAIDLTRVDENGSLIGSLRGITLNLGGGHIASAVLRFNAAGDGSTLWVLWTRSYYDPVNGGVPGSETILRPYALDGTPLAPEAILDGVEATNLEIVAASGRALVYWAKMGAPYSAMYASASVGAPVTVRTLVASPAGVAYVNPVRLGNYGALVWATPPENNILLGAAGGVLLDSGLDPVRAGATFLDEQIAGVPPFFSNGPLPTSLGSRLFVTTTDFRILWAGDNAMQVVDSVNWLDATGAALARTPVDSVRFPSVGAAAQAVFSDRVLVFGGSPNLATTVVWLNSGS